MHTRYTSLLQTIPNLWAFHRLFGEVRENRCLDQLQGFFPLHAAFDTFVFQQLAKQGHHGNAHEQEQSTKRSKSLHVLAWGMYERDLVRLSPASRKAFLLSSGVFHSSFFSSSFFFSFSSSTITRLAASLLHKKPSTSNYGMGLHWHDTPETSASLAKRAAFIKNIHMNPLLRSLSLWLYIVDVLFCLICWSLFQRHKNKQTFFLCLFAGLYSRLTNLSNQTYIDMHHLWMIWVICTLIFLDLTWLTSWLCCSEVIWGSSSLSSSLAKPLRRFSSMGISQTSFSHQELIILPEACRLAIPTPMQATGVVQTMAQKVICILLPYNPWSPCIPASWI